MKSRRKNISIIVIICTLTLVSYFGAINLLPTFMLYSDDNTETYLGKVSAVYTERHYTGYKNQEYTMVYIQVENGQVFHIPYLTLQKRNIEYEEFKETILNKTVVIKSAKSSSEKLVSIKHEEHSLLTYNDMNKTQQSNRIGLALVCIIVCIFSALLLILYPRYR